MALNDAQQLFAFFFAIYFFIIIDRSHVMYQSWDTYFAWKGKLHNINRLVAGWMILIVLPVTQFAILFTLLGSYSVAFEPTIGGIASIVLISISSFFTFGYFRIYEALLHRYPEAFFSEEELRSGRGSMRPDFRAHFIPGILYVILSTLLLLISLYI